MSRKLGVHSVPSRLERWRHLAEIVALLAAAVWALYVFVYQERIKPENEALRLQPSISVHHERLSAHKEYVEVEFDLKNLSSADVSLDGMIVNMYDRSMTATSAERVESPLNGITELNRTLALSPPKLLYSFYDTWHAFGAPAWKVNVINGGQDFRERIAFGIAPGSFNIPGNKHGRFTARRLPTAPTASPD